MVRNRVFDDFQELLVAGSGLDGELMKQLNHEATEALEGAGDADTGMDLDQDAGDGLDVHLQSAGSVHRRIQQREQTLVRDIGPGGGDILAQFGQERLVVIAIKQDVFDEFLA